MHRQREKGTVRAITTRDRDNSMYPQHPTFPPSRGVVSSLAPEKNSHNDIIESVEIL